MNVAIAARDAKIEAIANMSQITAREQTTSPLAFAHWQAEQVLDWVNIGAATSFWARAWNWILLFDDGMHYDSTQYTFDRMKGLQQQIDSLTQRIKQLEKNSESGRATNITVTSTQKS